MKLHIKQIYHYLFCLLVFSFPIIELVKAIPNITLGALAVLLPFVVKKGDFIKLKDTKYLLAFLLIIFILLRAILHNDFSEDFYVIKKLLIVVAIAILSLPIKNYKQIFISFIIAVFISILISSYSIINLIIEQGSFDFSRGDGINSILINERLYFGLLCCLSIVFSLKLFNETTNIKHKRALIISIIICVLFTLTIVARMAILTLMIVFLIRAFSRLNIKKAIVSILAVFVIIVIFFSVNKNLSQRFFYSDQKHEFIENIKIWEPRYVIWNCCINILNAPNSNMLLGNGFKYTTENLIKCYSEVVTKEKRKNWFVTKGFNTHNQYLDLLLSYGVIAFLIFSILLAYLVIISRKNIENLSIILIIIFFCTIENILHRQLGVFLFSIVLVFYNSEYFQSEKSIKHQ